MKHGIFPLIILLSIGCGTDTKRPNVTTLSTFKDSTSYALGADLGNNLKQQKVEILFRSYGGECKSENVDFGQLKSIFRPWARKAKLFIR